MSKSEDVGGRGDNEAKKRVKNGFVHVYKEKPHVVFRIVNTPIMF